MDTNPTSIFIYYLQRLAALLEKVERLEHGGPNILHERLADDMLPFVNQVRTTTNFALRACCPLSGAPVASFDNNDSSFPGLQRQISSTIEHLEGITPEKWETGRNTRFQDQAGFTKVSLPEFEYLHLYTLPNFFFHLSMVYAIARKQGIAVSKGDFDGYHSYPDGFSFEDH